MKITAKTLFGFEELLATELRNLGAKNIEVFRRAVAYSGDKELLYKSNLHLRTALKVLVPFYTFNAKNEDELYNKIYKYDWSRHLKVSQTFAISSAVNSNKFRHSKFVALKVKDAIVDQFRKKTGRRPSVDIDNPDIEFNVHTSGTEFTISLDSSGESLHKRGYRVSGHEAPLNEVLAAGMILFTEWDKETPLIDPMCGSGTLLFEAAMMSRNIPPAYFRKRFSFMNWPDYDSALWKKVYKEAEEGIKQTSPKLFGSDISPVYIQLCKNAADKIGLDEAIKFQVKAFEKLEPEAEEGTLVMNPPYGERITNNDMLNFYKSIGDTLKQKYAGFEAWILSSNKNALKHIGLRPSKKLTLFNGSLECKYQKFSMYKGSKKRKYRDGEE